LGKKKDLENQSGEGSQQGLQKLVKAKLVKVIQKIRRFQNYNRNITQVMAGMDSTVQKVEMIRQNFTQHSLSIPVFINTNVCTKCRSTVHIRTAEGSSVCYQCASSSTILSDNHELSANINKRRVSTKYNRLPLFRKFLMQFHTDMEPPPEHVISRLYFHFNKVHILLPVKVKPTPICQILRKEGLQKWCPMAIRIAKMMNDEPLVEFDDELVDRLTYRFDRISEIYQTTKSTERKKILNFEYLTRHFLVLEGHPEKALVFNLHKTRSVLTNADNSFRRCCAQLKTLDPDTNWNFKRSF
jgi:hypothetical protein